jgi:DNA repair protein RadC
MLENTEISYKIADMAEGDRPREKFLQRGREALTDAELLAILLATGYKNVSAVDLAKQILRGANNDLYALSRLSVKELMKIKGIGEAKALTIAAALELGRRRKNQETTEKPTISHSQQIYELYKGFFQDLPHEEFRVLLLNRANKPIALELISKGGLAGTVVDVRIVFKLALEHSASSLVLMHNHPSGSLQPSTEDLNITTQLKQAGKLLQIQVIDHLIFSDLGYTSLADTGKM